MKKFALLSGILAFLGIPFANATVEVRIINPITGDTGWVVCAAMTCTTGTVTVGNYMASVTAFQNIGINPLLDLSYTANTTNSNPGLLVFEAIANDYTVSTPLTALSGAGNSSLGDQIMFTSFGGTNNDTCPSGMNSCGASATPGNMLATSGFLPDNAGFNTTVFGGGNTVNPYALALQVALTSATSAGGASGDIKISSTVPEPASVVLLGGVLLFAASGLRRRRRQA